MRYYRWSMHVRITAIFIIFPILYTICFVWKAEIPIFDNKKVDVQTFSYVDKYAKGVKHSTKNGTKNITHSLVSFTPQSTVTDASRKPAAKSEGDDDLPSKSPIRCRNSSKFRIPNVLHYILSGNSNLPFHQYISMRSAVLIQKPDQVRIYMAESEPRGPYWDMFVTEVPCFVISKLTLPTVLHGKPITTVDDQIAVAKLQILQQLGGIYLETDVVVLNSFDPLMNEPCVVGNHSSGSFGQTVILAEKNSEFINQWLRRYSTANEDELIQISKITPEIIHGINPNISARFEDKLVESYLPVDARDSLATKPQALKAYSVHLNSRTLPRAKLEMTGREVLMQNNLYGSLARVGLRGKSDSL